MELIIGIIIGLLGILGLNFKRKSDKEKKLDKKEKEITNKLDKVNNNINVLEENGADDLKPEEVVGYWKDK